MVHKTCEFCKKYFSAKSIGRKMCSRACRGASQRRQVQRKCEWCGKLFETKLSYAQNGVYRFCNKECKGMARRGKSYYSPTPQDRKAASERLSKLWKTEKFRDTMGVSGRHQNSKGYWLVKSPFHPFRNKKGFVYEHRLVVECVIGRFLTKEECIHHINNTPGDNRPENLYLFTNIRSHSAYHADIVRGKVIPITESNLADYRVAN